MGKEKKYLTMPIFKRCKNDLPHHKLMLLAWRELPIETFHNATRLHHECHMTYISVNVFDVTIHAIKEGEWLTI